MKLLYTFMCCSTESTTTSSVKGLSSYTVTTDFSHPTMSMKTTQTCFCQKGTTIYIIGICVLFSAYHLITAWIMAGSVIVIVMFLAGIMIILLIIIIIR